MFSSLSERLSQTIRNLRGQGRLSEENIQESLREIRLALLEADVALPIVKDFIGHIKERAIGQEVMQSLTPGQALVKVVQEELTRLMGEVNESLNLNTTPPAIILMAGLQGSGKTTTTAKLALLLKEQKKKVLVVSADIYRPAAILQLKKLAEQIEVGFFPSDEKQTVAFIAEQALDHAKKQFYDVLIVDTAGRLHIDTEMMTQIKELHQLLNPVETLFVVDSMTGQDAANTAKVFHEALPLTGVVLTKTDGDARGGAALSIRMITGKPIKFLGVGEKITALTPFHPDRIASRILDMGDILSLVEDAQKNLDKDKAEKLAKKLQKGKSFHLEDFREQLIQMKKMGGLTKLIDKLPGTKGLPSDLRNKLDDNMFKRQEAIINSMTLKERYYPDIIKHSRKQRIAKGSGTSVQEINKLLKQFEQMQKMMKQVTKGGLGNMLKKFKGKLPPNLMPPQ